MGAGTLRLESDAGGDGFATARAIVGTLGLSGTWSITIGASVIAGARFEIGNGGRSYDHHQCGCDGHPRDVRGHRQRHLQRDRGRPRSTIRRYSRFQANGTYNADGGITGSAGTNRIIVAGTLNITGAANLGNGDDIVTLVTGATVTGTINGGGNVDTIILDGAGTDSLDLSNVGPGQQFVSFETLVKDGPGTWALTGNGSFGTVHGQ